MSVAEANCTVCGYSGNRWIISRVIDGKLFTVRQCKVCDHGYLHPLPTIEIISNLAKDYGLAVDNTLRNKEAMNHFDHLFETWINNHFASDDRTLLNVTNEEGAFENVARKYNWRTTTFIFKDLMSLLSELAEKGNQTTELLPDFQGKFGLIVLNHVFEHFFDPVKALLTISPWLRHNGCILVVVPNIDSDEAKMDGHKWKYINVPFHVNYFNKLSLDSLFTKKIADHGLKFTNMFQSTFPTSNQKEGESITTMYRLE